MTRMIMTVGEIPDRQRGESPARLVADDRLMSSPSFLRLLDHLQKSGEVEVMAVRAAGPVRLDEIGRVGAFVSETNLVVAFGGGSVIDHVKAARLYGDYPDPGELVERGWWPLQDADQGRVRVAQTFLAVPTTLGTGSEVNSNAVVDCGPRRDLFSSEHFRPSLAVHIPEVYLGLTPGQVLGSVIEILARVSEAYTSPGTPRADQVALAVGQRLVRAGLETACAGHTSAQQLLEIARLSAISHGPSLLEGRSPYAFRAWAVVNDLSKAVGCTKLAALCSVLPNVTRLDSSSEALWGDPMRRRQFFEAMARVDQSATLVPRAGLRSLVDEWGLTAASAPPSPEQLSRQVVARWGGRAGASHLGSMSEWEVRKLLSPSVE